MPFAASLYTSFTPAASFVRENKFGEGDYTATHRHDRGYKLLLSSKQMLIELLHSFVKREWVSHIDEASLIKVDKSFVLPDFRSKEADVVYRMRLKERDVVFYVLLELQSTVDPLMPWRLLLYQVEIWRQVVRDTWRNGLSNHTFKLPVIVPLVLYNGSRAWTAPLSFRELLAGAEHFPRDGTLNFSYMLLDIQRYTADDLEQLANVVGSVFLVDRQPDASLEETTLLLRRLAPTIDALSEEQRSMFAVWLEHTLRRLAKRNSSEEAEFRSLAMSFHKKGASTVISNLSRSIDKMMRKSALEGKKEGRIEGEALGKERAMEAVALSLLRKQMHADVITEVTGLTEARIAQLRQQL